MLKMNKFVVPFFVIMAVGITIVSVVSASPEPPVQTEQSQTFLNQNNISLKKSTTKPNITEKDAIELASRYCDVIAPTATSIKVEYHLMTNPGMKGFSEAAKAKNAQLNRDDYLNNTPVYIVTFKGINLKSMGGVPHGSKKQHVIFHENNVVVDANSGEILFSYSYK